MVLWTDLSHNFSYTLTVSDKASIRQELTPVFENFRQQLDGLSAGGNTAVYDALDTARAMLVNYRSDLTKLRKRIIIVSDGADTSSENHPREVCFAIQKIVSLWTPSKSVIGQTKNSMQFQSPLV